MLRVERARVAQMPQAVIARAVRAVSTTEAVSGVERIRDSGRAAFPYWVTNALATTALVGAAVCLSGCQQEHHEHELRSASGGAPTQKAADTSVVDSKGATSILARGVVATGVPTDPKGPRFYLLPANDASVVFDRVSRSSIYRVTTLGHVVGKEFTKSETADIHAVLDPLRPLWQCANLEMRQFARVNMLISGRFLTPNVGGVAYSGPSGLIALADSAHEFSMGFRGVVMHEVGHRLLQYSDPRTCTNYNDAYQNPVVKEFMERTGWKDAKTRDTKGRASSDAATDDYANTSPLEDMAQSFAWYLGNRAQLRKTSKSRAEFWDWFFAQMQMAPPNSLHDAGAFPGVGSNEPEPTVAPPPGTPPRVTPPPASPPPTTDTAPRTHEPPPKTKDPTDKRVVTIGNPQDRIWHIEVRRGDKITVIGMNWHGQIVIENR